jgi:hypothetical protein
VIAGERFAPDETLTTGVLGEGGGIVAIDSAAATLIPTTFEMVDLMFLLAALDMLRARAREAPGLRRC